MPLKYHIDDLGWHGFERLVQALLKVEIGIGIENWSGHSDRGRDAYCPSDLHFPARDSLSHGPFVFQVKYVGGANAAGAQPFGPLHRAVRTEVEEIRRRIARHEWQTPGSYVLLTNVPLTASRRLELRGLLRDVVPDAETHSLGATDICDLLDGAPNLRKAHPEILGLSDLQKLIREAVSAAVLERSAAAVQEAKDLSRVFVATRAYGEAHALLSKHSFVVLDGPPEMGKTAIARMVALTKVLEGWTAIECRNPDDFFGALDRTAHQVFVADDALGRTEFNIMLGRQWEHDLPSILGRLDAAHWLIWTTRKHILARALSSMDLAGRAQKFPLPAEVVVDAEALSVEEKALILYRHAKRAELPDDQKTLVREHARKIVKSRFFTPERIRRFVQEALPEIRSELEAGSLDQDALDYQIEEAIMSPTTRMRRAFDGLPEPHRSILIDMLECTGFCNRDRLMETYQRRHGDITERSFTNAVDDLTGTFLKTGFASSLDWIHPSYRDVVIDKVSQDAETQVQFLRTASVRGLRLAFSTEGGEAGARRMPFMRCPGSWEEAADRLASTIRGKDLTQVVEILRSVFIESRNDEELAERVDRLFTVVLDALSAYLGSERPLSAQQIQALHSLYSLDGVGAPAFQFSSLFLSRLSEIEEELRSDPEVYPGLVEELVALVNWVQRFEPLTIGNPKTQEKLDPVLEAFYEYAASVAEMPVDDYGDYEEEIEECERLFAAFNTINYGDIERADEMAHLLEIQQSVYLDSQIQEDSYEDEQLGHSTVGPFDIDGLFSDL